METHSDVEGSRDDFANSNSPTDRAGGLRARLAIEGLDRLTLVELVAICLGGQESSALSDAERLCGAVELVDLSRATAEHLRHVAGISARSSERLAACFALARRAELARRVRRPDLRSPGQVHALLSSELRGLPQETFHALLLDGKHRLRRRERVSQGTLTASLVHPREVFGPAVREGAAALIVAHNHPSGDPEPSAEDLAVTRRLLEVGRILGIPLLDHVVIGDAGFVSIRERIRFEAE